MSFTVYSAGLCYASVCTDMDDSEATGELNKREPTGISNPWTIADEPFHGDVPNPSPCELTPGHRHILFSC